MKQLFLPVVALFALIACNDAGSKTTGADSTKSAKDSVAVALDTPIDSAKMMEACTAFATTGPMHELLAKEGGNWTDDVSIWMAPNTPPSKMAATSSVSMILGGHYQQVKYSGSMEGMQFEGLSTTAYDNARKKFINTWMDNFGTGMIYLEGDYDKATKTIHYKGTQTDPVTAKQVSIRQDLTINGDGTETMTMYGPPMGTNGAEFKMMEVVSKRTK